MRRRQVSFGSGFILGSLLAATPAPPQDCNRNGLGDYGEIAAGQAQDCDANAVPDECDAETIYVDCNLNGIPESCEPFLDCNSNGERDSCEVVRRSNDCNHNLVPDDCERPASDPCGRQVWDCHVQDCNGNLVHDACDLANGSSLDEDHSGFPDECEHLFTIELGFRGPIRLQDAEEGSVRFEAVATLTPTPHVPLPPRFKVSGWSILVVPEGCTVVSATTDGTVAAPESKGGHRVEGFTNTGTGSSPFSYAYSAVVLTTQGVVRAFLPLDGRPYDILRLTLEADQPSDGICPRCVLRYVGFFERQPFDIVVTVDGDAAFYETDEATLCPGFRRGDVNTSGKVDISDPIRLFMSLFLGAETPACLDGADANDDGLVNITDGIFLLQDLFRGELGTVIPSPGPFECSPDPTEDTLDCEDPGGCS